MPLHHKQVKRASGSSWMCGHNTESATSKPPPFSPQRRDESKEGGRRREKIWDKFFSHTHIHTTSLSLLMEKLQHTSVAFHWESINLCILTASLVLIVWLWLPRTSFYCFWGFGKMYWSFKVCCQSLLYQQLIVTLLLCQRKTVITWLNLSLLCVCSA